MSRGPKPEYGHYLHLLWVSLQSQIVRRANWKWLGEISGVVLQVGGCHLQPFVAFKRKWPQIS